MRLNEAVKAPVNRSLPLRLVSRGSQANGRKSTHPPAKEFTLRSWGMLREYLTLFSSKMKELAPIAEKVAKKNTVIVLVCNFGQSELLMNFVCAAKARGFDLSPILLFATDIETKELAESLGITSWFDEEVRRLILLELCSSTRWLL
jgi:hypothetical protein